MTRILTIVGMVMLTMSIPAQPQANKVLYAGLVKSKGYVVGAKLSASGLYRYVGDTTWQHLGWNHPRVSAVAVDPNNSQIIFLACGNGALRSLDGGKSWRIATDWRVTESQDICVDPNDPQSYYLATAYGIWRTHDRGDTWIEASAGLKKRYTQAIAVDRSKQGRLIAATEGGIYLSADGAENWKLAGPSNVSTLDVQQSASALQIWIAGTDSNGVWLSSDNAKTWRSAGGPPAEKNIYTVAIDPFNEKLMAAAGWDTYVYVSDDGGATWRQVTDGLPVPHVYRMVSDGNDSGALWAATLEEGIFYLPPGGSTWEFRGMYGALVFDLTFIREISQ